MADGPTLATALGCSRSTAAAYADDINRAMLAAGCTTVNRCAMFLAQIGHESLGLRYMEEIASGADYEGRRDLGNVQPGDGRRFKGRGPIQLTGRTNYASFGRWAESRGLVDRADYFTRAPAVVATSQWGFLAASWYWTVARPRLNTYADAGDIASASREVNGWVKLKNGSWRTPNGMADRTSRWDRCRRLGPALLPTGESAPGHTEEDDDMDDEDRRMLREIYMQHVQGDGRANDPRSWGWPGWAGGTGEHLTVVDMLRRANVEIRQLRNQVADLAKKITERN